MNDDYSLDEDVEVLLDLKDIYDEVVGLASCHDQDSLQKLLLSIEGRKDYMEVETTMCRALLENDFVDMYRTTYELGYLNTWCRDNTRHVVYNCPQLLQCWATQSGERPAAVYARVADQLGSMPEHERIQLLRGQTDALFEGYHQNRAHSLLHQALALGGKQHWRNVSPVWLGAPDSQLRQAAQALGWESTYLPAMVHRNIWKNSADKWLGHVPFPYTLMACEEFRYAKDWGDNAPAAPEVLTCKKTTAVDIAMAKVVLKACAHGRNMALRRPASIKALSPSVQLQVEGFVQAHVMMDTVDQLAHSLAVGQGPLLGTVDSLELPELFLDTPLSN